MENKEEILKSAEETIEKARIAESLISSSAWQKVFEPLILNKKIEFYKDIENSQNLEASKLVVKVLKELKLELEDLVNQAEEAKKVVENLTK